MRISLGLQVVLSLAIVTSVSLFGYTAFTPRGIPIDAHSVDDFTYVLHARSGMALPPGIADGDLVDTRKLSLETRSDVMSPKLPLGYMVNLVVERGSKTVTVPVQVVAFRSTTVQGTTGFQWYRWPGIFVFRDLLLGAIALLLLWRGRDRAAFGMALWSITYLFSEGLNAMPLMGWAGLGALFLGIASYLSARIGFYIMIDARLSQALSLRQQTAFRLTFYVVLGCGALQAFGSQLILAITGSARFLDPRYGLILSASYLIPIVMLFAGYRAAPAGERLRLRWMMASGLAWALSILLQNTPILGDTVSNILGLFLQVTALLGFLYAVLKLRVVDISVVIDRALVYGLVTTLVIGVIAATNNLALRETLTPGAGPALQLILPLALGIVLGRVRSYVDFVVERVFFRSKFLTERALKAFARHAYHYEDLPKLLDSTVQEIQRHVGPPAMAIYAAEGTRYRRLRYAGDIDFPPQLDKDDPALVAIRAEHQAVDLADVVSALGSDGCVFPMTVSGTSREVLICANRPGSHYATFEKVLLTAVAQAVGAAWRNLRARDNEAYIQAMAAGEFSQKSARELARSLVLN